MICTFIHDVTALRRDCAGRACCRAMSFLAGGKVNGRRGEGIKPGYREQGGGQHGKGFGAEAVTERPADEAAEESEGDQDAGGKPGRGRDADRQKMGDERRRIR
jgi:hypothetical protein